MGDGIGDDEPQWRKDRKAELVAEGTDYASFLRVASLMQPQQGDFGIYLELAAEYIEKLRLTSK